MLKSLMTASAVVALLAAAPAVAENATQPPAATGDQAAPKLVQPTTTLTTPAPAGATEAAAPAAATQMFIGQQEDGQMLASSIMGKTVYDSANNNLGSVNDIVFDKDGKTIIAVVVGVGGFLGIGQKNVAVSMSALSPSTDANGDLKLVLNATKDDLDNAPAFKTLADLMAPQAPADGASPASPATPAQ